MWGGGYAVVMSILRGRQFRRERTLRDEMAAKAATVRQSAADPVCLVLRDGRMVGAWIRVGRYITAVPRDVDAAEVVDVLPGQGRRLTSRSQPNETYS